MVLEDYTLKHVWGPQIQTPIKAPVAASTSRLSNPGSFTQWVSPLSRLLVKGRERAGGKLPERFSQRQKKPDPGQAHRDVAPRVKIVTVRASYECAAGAFELYSSKARVHEPAHAAAAPARTPARTWHARRGLTGSQKGAKGGDRAAGASEPPL